VDDRLRAAYGTLPPEIQIVDGVCLNCVGDKEIYGRNLIEPAFSPRDYVVATERRSFDLGDKVGISLMFSYFPYAPAWCGPDANKHPGRSAINPVFTVLRPKHFWAGSGSVFLARKDAKPLHLAHVEALYSYIDELSRKKRRSWGDYLLRELRGLWRLRRKVYCYERGYEPYIYELCVSTDVGSRQTVVPLRWAVEVEIDYWVL
jgi:hypothetical protein